MKKRKPAANASKKPKDTKEAEKSLEAPKAIPKERRRGRYAELMKKETQTGIYKTGHLVPMRRQNQASLAEYYNIRRMYGGSDFDSSGDSEFPTFNYPQELLTGEAPPTKWIELMQEAFCVAEEECLLPPKKPRNKKGRKAYDAERQRRLQTLNDVNNADQYLDIVEKLLRRDVEVSHLATLLILGYEVGRLAERVLVRRKEFSTVVGEQKRNQRRPTAAAKEAHAERRHDEYVEAQRAKERAGGNISQAARRLGISRKTFYKRLGYGTKDCT